MTPAALQARLHRLSALRATVAREPLRGVCVVAGSVWTVERWLCCLDLCICATVCEIEALS